MIKKIKFIFFIFCFLAQANQAKTDEEEDSLMAVAFSQGLQKGQMQSIVVKSSIQTEWDEYKPMPRPTENDGQSNILNWWKANELKLLLPSAVARHWLSIPVSSSSERAFSLCGSIVLCKRTRLQPEKVDKLLYIQQNFDRVEIRRWMFIFKDKFDEAPQLHEDNALVIPQLSTYLPIGWAET